jgi:hypothetical protein
VEALIPITMFMCIAAVMILRPVTKKLGGLLEAISRDRTQARAEDANTTRVVALMEHMHRRLDHLEERLDFTERLVSDRRPDGRRSLGRTPMAEPRLDPSAALQADY